MMLIDTQCEVCGAPLRVLMLPGLHALCMGCSKELRSRIGQRQEEMVNAAIAGMRESGFIPPKDNRG